MNTLGYLVFGYMGFGVLLVFWAFYLSERLKRYIDIKYPDEGRVIRSYEWQWFPWSVGARTLRELIRKQSANDIELAHRAKKANCSWIYFETWFVLFILAFSVFLIYHLLTHAK